MTLGRLGSYGPGPEIERNRSRGGTVAEGEESESDAPPLCDQTHCPLVDWGDAQRRCHHANRHRFDRNNTLEPRTAPFVSKGTQTVPKSAVVIRTWVGFRYTPQAIVTLRAMINELALGSGGEYDIHLLLHVKDNSVLFWESQALYEEIRAHNVPEEFRGLVTLWSEKQMETVYPGPFTNNTENRSGKSIHGVWRSPHMPLQYFAQNHPEYDFYWNWEMDVRSTGHYYELFDKLGRWARDQPRRGLWERNAKYHIEGLHSSWNKWAESVEKENEAAGNTPVWGPLLFPNSGALHSPQSIWPPDELETEAYNRWGIGEEADLITLSPMFDPDQTRWMFDKDVTGYDLDLPIPPRRVSIVAAARLSRRLLHLMHEEVFTFKRTMWTEMWPPSCALHYGLKAVYAPHPVYFDRNWPVDAAEKIFNGGKYGSSGGNASSVFGSYQHNLQGSTWYHNARFAGALWRRWLGQEHDGGGGEGLDRMCLRSMLLHPVKHEA
ncbi:hypothetical protein LTR50_000011 [Elasticomyces elasticus]|nr:hypothetical protein LTR50_000011 [Elasticomyces elasticus]